MLNDIYSQRGRQGFASVPLQQLQLPDIHGPQQQDDDWSSALGAAIPSVIGVVADKMGSKNEGHKGGMTKGISAGHEGGGVGQMAGPMGFQSTQPQQGGWFQKLLSSIGRL